MRETLVAGAFKQHISSGAAAEAAANSTIAHLMSAGAAREPWGGDYRRPRTREAMIAGIKSGR
jgi:hypothetical protein